MSLYENANRLSLQLMKLLTITLLLTACGHSSQPEVLAPVLQGKMVKQKVLDFRFVDQVGQCALQIGSEGSLDIHCWTLGKQLFVGCENCQAASWHKSLAAAPDTRIKIDQDLYSVRISLMSDKPAMVRAWKHRNTKYGLEQTGLPGDVMVYHLSSLNSLSE